MQQTSYTIKSHIVLAAEYNQWINQRLYSVVGQLDETAFSAARGAFFSSISGTLNHIMVADLIWLNRFKKHSTPVSALLQALGTFPQPQTLSSILYPDFNSLQDARRELDQLIIELCNALQEKDLDKVLVYTNTKGQPFNKKLGFLLQHFFNHQTHHRGQLTTLLSQLELDVGVTDLLVITPDAL
ncbi:DinB family protein [Neptunicella sp. SCSIO 80796]|uniref:DinB family protein n=1 Tax=Neptunicella plasticusilytica TaxID=3117012 RepID=UPI003A4D7B33